MSAKAASPASNPIAANSSMVTKATVTSSKTLDFSFRGPLGFEANTVVAAIESSAPNQVAFESWGGNIDLMGLIDFEEVRPDCTEVTLCGALRDQEQALRLARSAFRLRRRLPHRRAAQPALALRRHRRSGHGTRAGLRNVRAAARPNGQVSPLERSAAGQLAALFYFTRTARVLSRRRMSPDCRSVSAWGSCIFSPSKLDAALLDETAHFAARFR